MEFKSFHFLCESKNDYLGDIVFIHGYCVEHSYFNIAKDLSKNFNVYMIDLPAHGVNVKDVNKKELNFKSYAKHVVAYIEKKGLKNIFLIGHSMGGGIVSIVANMIPDKIKKLILIAPYGMAGFHLVKEIGYFKAIKIFTPRNMEEKYKLLSILYENVEEKKKNPAWDYVARRQLEWQLQNWDNMKILNKDISSIFTMSFVAKCQKNISVPTLLLLGRHDRAVDPVTSERLFRKYFANKPNLLDIKILENSGHVCFEDDPKFCINTITKFCSSK